MTEDEIIATVFAPLAAPGGFGLRDDAAVLSPEPGQDLVTTVDALVAGVHFFPDDPPTAIAAKALGVNLSDLAAKGAQPSGFLLALALPKGTSDAWIAALAQGLGEAARAHGCPLLGGDTVHTPGPLTVSITAFGTVPAGRMVPRTGLRPGDHLFVSGTIGDAALGLALRLSGSSDLGAALAAGLPDADQDFLRWRYLLPQPRLPLAPILLAQASAGMDVSDGLVGDLRKMLRASGAGARVNLTDVPFSQAARRAMSIAGKAATAAVTGGDDYELLVGVRPERRDQFRGQASAIGMPVTEIGIVLDENRGVEFLDARGMPVIFERGSFQHF